LKNEFPTLRLGETLPGFPGLPGKLLNIIRNPWPANKPYWKNQVKGACQMLSFHTRPEKASLFVEIVAETCSAYGYPYQDLGIYIQPIEHNRACRPEFTFFYDPEDPSEKAVIRDLFLEAAKACLNEGAVFTRPYGDLAPIIYERTASYTAHLKRLKKVFDPNLIMNPSNLCF